MRLTDAQLRELQRHHGPAIRAYLVRRVDPPSDADAAFNEVLEVAWRRADTAPSEDDRVRIWLFAIAARVAANHRRTSVRRRRLVDRLTEDLRLSPPPQDASDDVVKEVRAAIERLPARQRELVRLVHWDGFTLTDAAEVLRIAPSTARSHYQSARERLRMDLGERVNEVSIRRR